MLRFIGLIICFLFSQSIILLAGDESIYDPSKIDEKIEIKIFDLVVNDIERNREIPVRFFLPPLESKAPVILFSHGLGGSLSTNTFLGQHWSKRGYITVCMQHKGSDESVWKGKSVLNAFKDMKKAASAENLILRVKDVSSVIDQLEKWNLENGHVLKGKINLDRIGMSGHSFGAITTQFVSGQKGAIGMIKSDSRIKASCIFSPSLTKGLDAKKSFAEVNIPWLLMTGTKDVSLINDIDVNARLAVFLALPVGNKYELVLDKAEHSIFSDKGSRRDKEVRNKNHHKAILAISTSFWDCFLKDDKDAKEWLEGDVSKFVLEKKDRWQKK